MTAALDLALVLLLVALAAWTVTARGAFAAVVGFIAYGAVAAIAWVQLGAPDVALTEAALGSGLTGALMVTACGRLPNGGPAEAPSGPRLRLLAAVLSVLVAAALGGIVLCLPSPGPTLAPEAVAPLGGLGLGNAVTGVLIVYRATDTLLEKLVLIIGLVGVWSLARDADWGRVPALIRPARGGPALGLLARLLPPVGILVGLYTLWVSAKEPGGAFQGGTILAAMAVLTVMAGRLAPPRSDRIWLRAAIVGGPLLFLAVGFLGLCVAGGFLAYPAGLEKPVILLVEIVLTLSVAAILALLAAGPPAR